MSGAVLSLGLLGAASAQAQEQCATYTVVSGDTFSKIASTANVRGGFQILFNANTDVLDNPNCLEIGEVLKIPCADGTLPGAATTIAAVATGPAPVTSMPNRPLRIITGSDYAPFTDEDLEGGGALTMMVRRAVECHDDPPCAPRGLLAVIDRRRSRLHHT